MVIQNSYTTLGVSISDKGIAKVYIRCLCLIRHPGLFKYSQGLKPCAT